MSPISVSTFQEYSLRSPSVTGVDLIVDVEGFTYFFGTFSASDEDPYSYLAVYAFSDYLLNADESVPSQIIQIVYQKPETYTIFIEIYEYENVEDAQAEYDLQVGAGTAEAPMTTIRFGDEQRLLQKENFFIVAFGASRLVSTFEDDFRLVLSTFLENMLSFYSETTQSDPPPVSFIGKVVWGIQPGDKIVWTYKKSPYYNPHNIEWEIVDISDDNLAVLIKEMGVNLDLFGEGKVSSLVLDLPIYTWGTVDTDGLSADSTLHDYSSAILYPLYAAGCDLRAVVESRMDLSEVDIIESAQYINGYAHTYNPPDFTPIITQDKRISIHRGTGIVTSSSWNYQDRDLEIGFSILLTLNETNFNLENRPPYDPIADPSTPSSVSPSSQPSESQDNEPNDREKDSNGGFGTPGFSWISVYIIGLLLCIIRKKRQINE